MCMWGGLHMCRVFTISHHLLKQNKTKINKLEIVASYYRINRQNNLDMKSQLLVFILWLQIHVEVKWVKSLSCVWLFATPWTAAYQAPQSMGFSRQEYWSGGHFLLQGIFLTQGSNPGLPHCRQMLYRSMLVVKICVCYNYILLYNTRKLFIIFIVIRLKLYIV